MKMPRPTRVAALAATLAVGAAGLVSVSHATEEHDVEPAPVELTGPALRLEMYRAPERGFHVVSTLIVGATESILFDGQYKVSDGSALAEKIAATGTTLRAIVLSHADHDHYMGAMEVVKRFPGTPVYMTRAGLDDFEGRSQRDLERERRRGPDPDVPEALVEPELLPADTLHVDGLPVVAIDGLVGDVRAPVSTALWIPSLRAVLAGDLVFEGVHPWLGDSDRASRVEWRASLGRLEALDPDIVVPGHKRDLSTPNAPGLIADMIRYLKLYDESMDAASTYDDVVTAMVEAYPDLELPVLMAYGARKWFKR